jgi:hypothetical protein
MLYDLPHIKLKMDIDDVPDSGQPVSSGMKLLAKRKAKVLPDELLDDGLCSESCQVCHCDRFPTKTAQPMAKTARFVAKYQITTTENKVILFDLTNLMVVSVYTIDSCLRQQHS